MTDFSGRLRRVEVSKGDRLYWRDRYKNHVPRRFLVFIGLLVVVAVAAGVVLGMTTQPEYSTDGVEEFTAYNVDGYEIVFLPSNHPDMEGSTIGFDRFDHNKRFYIEEGLSLDQVERVCVHELMHDHGIPGGDTEAHDWIDLMDSKLVGEDPTCTRLVDRLKQEGY